MKRCTKCGVEKPEADFPWNGKTPKARISRCAECKKAYAAAYRSKHREEINAKLTAYKREWRAANPNAGKEWYAANREKELERCRQRLQVHGEQVRARRRTWYRRDPSVQRKATQAWVSKNREHVREYQRSYTQAHLPEAAEKRRQRRARELAATIVALTDTDIDARMSVFGYRCAYCAGPYEEVDHVIPLSRGGPHCLANLRPACTSCNRRKWAKSIHDWKRTAS